MSKKRRIALRSSIRDPMEMLKKRLIQEGMSKEDAKDLVYHTEFDLVHGIRRALDI